MTTVESIRGGRLSRWQLLAVVVAALLVALGVFAVTPLQGRAGFVLVAAVAVVAAVGAVSWGIEGRRHAVDRVAATFAYTAFLVAILPLAFVLGYTIVRGVKRLSVAFLTHSMAGVGPLSPEGGIYHAIVGTLEQVLIASLIAVPLGLLVSIYITEYGTGSLAAVVRFFIDVMTGIPSIVAGLFVLAFWVIGLHQGFSGFAGAMSLAILELPVVVRSTEEMIKLVPASLREASYALGVPKWKTILRIVLPTAASGITTGVMLAVARVIGETAPLLLTIGGNTFIHLNPLKGQQSALPLFVFDQAGRAFEVAINRAWAAALTLILIVVVLYVAARLLTRRSALSAR